MKSYIDIKDGPDYYIQYPIDSYDFNEKEKDKIMEMLLYYLFNEYEQIDKGLSYVTFTNITTIVNNKGETKSEFNKIFISYFEICFDILPKLILSKKDKTDVIVFTAMLTTCLIDTKYNIVDILYQRYLKETKINNKKLIVINNESNNKR